MNEPPASPPEPASGPWHEQDAFWAMVGRSMFSEYRRGLAPSEVEQVIELASVQPEAHVLDMPCGVGRHALEFARRGFTVTAVDRTRSYLDEAAACADAEGVALELVQADMREFARLRAFDLAINLYTSFGYFEDKADELRVLRNFRRSLRAGGVLVMDLMGKEVLAREFQERGWQEQNGTLVLEEREILGDWEWVRTRQVFIRDAAKRELSLQTRLYSAAELRALLLQAGFVEVSVFGGLDGAPYDQNARRLVVVARKVA